VNFIRPEIVLAEHVFLIIAAVTDIFTRLLSSMGAGAVGIDISPVSVGRARSLTSAEGLKAEFQVMDAGATTFPSASFDFTINGVLNHLDLARA
jgi:2-polyprenyl-3-methyl-5-hydroxy-6-metoxy-1,4-benzoquinol methylase